MPGPSDASRTPHGSLTLTMPLCRKNSEVAGSPVAMMRWPGPDGGWPTARDGSDLVRVEPGEQRLLAEIALP